MNLKLGERVLVSYQIPYVTFTILIEVYLGHQILSIGNGDYYFENGLRIIKTLAEVNDEWSFDPSLNYTAEVTGINGQNLFGVIDSLKTIMIFDSTDLVVDSILISKHFGLIRFPLWNGDYYMLEVVQSDD